MLQSSLLKHLRITIMLLETSVLESRKRPSNSSEWFVTVTKFIYWKLYLGTNLKNLHLNMKISKYVLNMYLMCSFLLLLHFISEGNVVHFSCNMVDYSAAYVATHLHKLISIFAVGNGFVCFTIGQPIAVIGLS